jgi:hypothetical protein
MRTVAATVIVVFMIAASMSPAPAQAGDDKDEGRIHDDSDDREKGSPRPNVDLNEKASGKVKFANDCVVSYDKGRRTKKTGECTSSQVQRADDLASARRRVYDKDHGEDGGRKLGNRLPFGDGDGDSDGSMRIVEKSNQQQVIFKDACVVYYNQSNQRTKSMPNCTREQVLRADETMAARRRQGK